MTTSTTPTTPTGCCTPCVWPRSRAGERFGAALKSSSSSVFIRGKCASCKRRFPPFPPPLENAQSRFPHSHSSGGGSLPPHCSFRFATLSEVGQIKWPNVGQSAWPNAKRGFNLISHSLEEQGKNYVNYVPRRSFRCYSSNRKVAATPDARAKTARLPAKGQSLCALPCHHHPDLRT